MFWGRVISIFYHPLIFPTNPVPVRLGGDPCTAQGCCKAPITEQRCQHNWHQDKNAWAIGIVGIESKFHGDDHLFPSFPIFSHLFPSFPIFSHLFPSFPIFSHLFPSFPIFSHLFPSFPIFSHLFPSFPFNEWVFSYVSVASCTIMLWFSQSSSSNSCAKAKCLLMKATSCARQVTAQGSWPAAVNIPILNCVDCDESQPSCMVGSRPQVTWGTWISHGYHMDITWRHDITKSRKTPTQPYASLRAQLDVRSEVRLNLNSQPQINQQLSCLY